MVTMLLFLQKVIRGIVILNRRAMNTSVDKELIENVPSGMKVREDVMNCGTWMLNSENCYYYRNEN